MLEKRDKMKKLFFYCVVIGVMCCVDIANAADPDVKALVPLSKYIEKNDLKDPAPKSYVYDRCISLFMAFTVGSKNQKGEESEKFVANSRAAYSDVAKAEALLFLKSSKDPEAALKEHSEVVKRLQKVYSSRMDKVLDMGQDLMEDVIVGGDLNICAEVVKVIRTNK